jgi:hypothetical protein
MSNTGFFTRALPFAAAVIIGLFITSLFVDLKMPRLGKSRKAEVRRIKAENEHLKNENLKLRNMIEQLRGNGVDVSGIDVELSNVPMTVPPVPSVPMYKGRHCDKK